MILFVESLDYELVTRPTCYCGAFSRRVGLKLSGTIIALTMKGVTLAFVRVAGVKDGPFNAISQIRALRPLRGTVQLTKAVLRKLVAQTTDAPCHVYERDFLLSMMSPDQSDMVSHKTFSVMKCTQ